MHYHRSPAHPGCIPATRDAFASDTFSHVIYCIATCLALYAPEVLPLMDGVFHAPTRPVCLRAVLHGVHAAEGRVVQQRDHGTVPCREGGTRPPSPDAPATMQACRHPHPQATTTVTKAGQTPSIPRSVHTACRWNPCSRPHRVNMRGTLLRAQTAGPVALARTISEYSRVYDTTVTVLAPGTVFPYNWWLVRH